VELPLRNSGLPCTKPFGADLAASNQLARGDMIVTDEGMLIVVVALDAEK